LFVIVSGSGENFNSALDHWFWATFSTTFRMSSMYTLSEIADTSLIPEFLHRLSIFLDILRTYLWWLQVTSGDRVANRRM
jgi:hypothetical protein